MHDISARRLRFAPTCWGLFALLIGIASPLYAADFDEEGRVDLSQSSLSHSLDDLTPGGVFTHHQISATNGSTTPEFVQDPKGLEGEGALKTGGKQSRTLLFFGSDWDKYKGRRVNVTFWMKPQGTDAFARIFWFINSPFSSPNQPWMSLGSMRFIPTGRATSDGWVELGTGPFDFALGGAVMPEVMALYDTQHFKLDGPLGDHKDEEAFVLIDALEVQDLGPALVPADRCNGFNQEQVCGEQGLCLMGRCVDAKVVLGHAPTGQIGKDYMARRIFEVDAFAGVRAARASMPEFKKQMLALDPEKPKQYWHRFAAAYELLVDGHGLPPSDSYFQFSDASGVCLGPGTPDLLPQAAALSEMMPMVFSANTTSLLGKLVQPGDVLTKIDGSDVWLWVQKNQGEFYTGGDPDGRRVYHLRSLIDVARKLGSTLQFERCSNLDGTVCQTPDVILVDLAVLVGEPLWRGEISQGLSQASQECDYRFKRPVAVNGSPGSYHQVGWQDEGEIRHLLINATPRPSDPPGQQWHNTVDRALSSGPSKVLLDQRIGYGGAMEGVARVAGHLLRPANNVVAYLIPWLGSQTLDQPLLTAFVECAKQETHACGGFIRSAITSIVSAGGSRDSKLAVIHGFDISGNDYLARFLTFRDAPSRHFGYAPTQGAFGASCTFPKYMSELGAMRYQCQDTQFLPNESAPSPMMWESSFGATPDEIIHQKQSDAINEKDTVIEAAKSWLLEEGGAP